MARPKKNTEEQSQKQTPSKSLLSKLIDENPENFLAEDANERFYLVSTGSLAFDIAIGGIPPGLHRFCGETEGGKTSESLLLMRNHITAKPRRKGLVIKAEGRLSKQLMERSEIKFVFNPEDWVDGTCLVLETQICEDVDAIFRAILTDNKSLPPDQRLQYFILLDSLDALMSRDDFNKTAEQDTRVGGISMWTTVTLKRMAFAMSRYGHIAIFISQKREKIKGPYQKAEPQIVGSTGGHAILHYPDFIFEFEGKFAGDIIKEDPNSPISAVNKPIGHWVTVHIRKSPNETTGFKIQYPVKYGRTGNCVWIEREILKLAQMYHMIEKKGTWFAFSESLLKHMESDGIECSKQLQGEEAFVRYMEENEQVRDFIIKKLREIAIGDTQNFLAPELVEAGETV